MSEKKSEEGIRDFPIPNTPVPEFLCGAENKKGAAV
jgi:hypothetical protein